MNAMPTDIRARIARERQQQLRDERARIRSLSEHDKRAALAAALFGHPAAPEDLGTDGEAALAREIVLQDADGEQKASYSRRGKVQQHRKIACECLLERLCLKGELTYDQKEAGMVFRGKWLASAHSSRVAAAYGERFGHSSGGLSETEYRLDARLFIDRCLEILSPPQQRAVKWVCGEDKAAGLMLPTLVRALDAIDQMLRSQRQRRG